MTKGWKAAIAACLLLLILAAIRPAALVATRACSLQEPSGGQRETDGDQSKAGVEATLSRAALRAVCGLLGEVKPSSGADGKKRSPELPKWTDEVQAWSAGAVALLTLVLLVVNGFQFRFLVRSTRATEAAATAAKTAAEAAKLQSRAAVASELAEIKLVQMDLVVSPLLPGQSEVVIPPGPLPSRALVSPIFLNAGRTRCRIVEFCIEWRVLSREAPGVNIDIVGDPEYRDIFRNDVIFYPDQPLRMTWRIGNNFEVNLTEEQVALIARNDAWLWVWGYVAYANFIQEVHEVGFAAHWEAVADATFPKSGHPAPRGMVIEGPPQFFFERQRNV